MLSRSWRDAYTTPVLLSKRTFRIVYGAMAVVPRTMDTLRNALSGISIFVFVSSWLLHGWALMSVLFAENAESIRFLTEFIVCVVIAAAIEVFVWFCRQALTFRILVMARLSLIAVAVIVAGAVHPHLVILLSLPLFAEVVVYDDGEAAFAMIAVCALVLGGALVYSSRHLRLAAVIWNAGEFVLICGLFVAFAAIAVAYREDNIRKTQTISSLESTIANLADANKAFQSYADNLESESADKERERISNELHDTVGYALTNVIVMMNAAKILLNGQLPEVRDLLERVGNQSEQALNEVRRTLHELHATRSIEPKGLEAIYGLTRAFGGATGIRVSVNRGNMPWSVGPRLDSIIFALVRESLTNAFRHGKASEVTVDLWRAADEVRVTVTDNGKGQIHPDNGDAGIGLSSLRRKLGDVGGTLRAESLAGVGFAVRVRIPFRMGGIGAKNQSAHS